MKDRPPFLKAVVLTIAELPFATIVAAIVWLARENASFWKSPSVYAILAVSLALAGLWSRHVLRTRETMLLVSIFTLGFVWILIRTEWVVGTKYEYMDNLEYRTYSPPRSPIFLPPTPQSISPYSTSWRDSAFFAGGGTGGPIEEPGLSVNWLMNLLRLSGFTILTYMFLSGFFGLERRFYKLPARA